MIYFYLFFLSFVTLMLSTMVLNYYLKKEYKSKEDGGSAIFPRMFLSRYYYGAGTYLAKLNVVAIFTMMISFILMTR